MNRSVFLQRAWQAWRRRVLLPVRRVLSPETEVIVGRHRLRIDLRDRVIGRLLYSFGDYAPHLTLLLRLAARPGSLCLDVGANLGLCSLVLQNAVGPGGRVLAFEPEGRNYRLLEHNLRLNGCHNVRAFRAAVGEKHGAVTIRRNTVNFGDHRVTTCPEGTPAAAPLVCIDDVLADHRDLPVSVVKIDVQGFELQVLRGMQRTLETNPDLVLIMEVFPEGLREAGSSGSELMDYARSAGMVGYEFSDWRVQPLGEPECYDWLRDGKDVDCVMSGNSERVTGLIREYSSQVFAVKIARPASTSPAGRSEVVPIS